MASKTCLFAIIARNRSRAARTTGRRLVMYLPALWPWANAWTIIRDTTTTPPDAITP